MVYRFTGIIGGLGIKEFLVVSRYTGIIGITRYKAIIRVI